MFPVTLEAADGRLQTYSTACYGFLRGYEWEDDDYDFCQGWNRLVTYPWAPSSATEPFGRNCIYHYGNAKCDQNPRIELEDLKTIWNSGAVLPFIGLAQNSDAWIAFQTYCGAVTYGGEARPEKLDNIARWSRERGIEYTREQFLLALQDHVDAGQESALLFDQRGFTGVRADVPADRALFYLMIDRELWEDNEYQKIRFMMEQIHDKGRNPMIAFLMSRLISTTSGALSDDEPYYCGHTHDNCILPDSLIVKGLGKKYQSPTSIDWFQAEYTSGNGHLRDDDIDEEYDSWGFSGDGYSCRHSSSIFNSVFMLEQEGDKPTTLKGSDEPAIPVKVLFARATIPESELNGRPHRMWDLGDWLEDVGFNNNLLIGKEQFEELAFNLLMGD